MQVKARNENCGGSMALHCNMGNGHQHSPSHVDEGGLGGQLGSRWCPCSVPPTRTITGFPVLLKLGTIVMSRPMMPMEAIRMSVVCASAATRTILVLLGPCYPGGHVDVLGMCCSREL